MADATTSLYFSNGGGIIGSREHEAVAEASKTFVAFAEHHARSMDATTTYPLPAIGKVRFYLLAFSGILTTEVDEGGLQQGSHDLTLLYAAGQDVITQVRLNTELT